MLQARRDGLKWLGERALYPFLRSTFLARALPFQGPPVLVLSYPRSGSSWVGKILSASPDAAYLREPITRQYAERGARYAVVDVDRDPSALAAYRTLGDEAFGGIPPRHADVVERLHDFAFGR